MNEAIYEFVSRMKLRRQNPKTYTALLVLALLISVPNLFSGLVFTILFFSDFDPQFLSLFYIILIFMIIIPCVILIAAIALFRAESCLKFTFGQDSFDVYDFKSKKQTTVPYSAVSCIKASRVCYLIFINKRRAYPLSADALKAVTADEFDRFLYEHTGKKVLRQ